MEIWSQLNYIKDIKFLIEIIEDKQIQGDFKGLKDIIDEIEKNDRNLIDYKLLCFSIYLKGAIAGVSPKDLHFCKIDLQNRLSIKDSLSEDKDPLHNYSLDLKVSLFKSEKKTDKEYCCTWHLDKEDRGLNFSYIHPYYHFQFGGKKHEYLDPDMAILSSPRIPHPPMDIILAFHFIINNFIDRKKFSYVDDIKKDPRYLRIVQNSKKRLWEAYFNGFSLNFNHADYKIDKLFPLYI